MRYVICVLIGVLAGIFSGLFGVGGGIIAIPLLVVACAFPQHLAQGTATFMIVPTVMTVGWRYFRAGNADPAAALALAFGSVPLGFLSATLAQRLPEVLLRRGFALLLLAVAAQLWFTAPRQG